MARVLSFRPSAPARGTASKKAGTPKKAAKPKGAAASKKASTPKKAAASKKAASAKATVSTGASGDASGAKTFAKRRFADVRVDAGTFARDLVFVDCTFEGCDLGGMHPEGPLDHPAYVTVERVTLIRPKCESTQLSLAILRDVVVDDWYGAKEPTFFRNFLFDRVTLRGRVKNAILRAEPERLSNRELDVALDFYDGVEWALDVREANFESFELRGAIPGEKVRRDPKRHCLLFKDRLRQDARWRKFSEERVDFLEERLSEPGDTDVLFASDRSKSFPKDLEFHALLRSKGYAE